MSDTKKTIITFILGFLLGAIPGWFMLTIETDSLRKDVRDAKELLDAQDRRIEMFIKEIDSLKKD